MVTANTIRNWNQEVKAGQDKRQDTNKRHRQEMQQEQEDELNKTSVSIGGTRTSNKLPYVFDPRECVNKAFADETNLKEFMMGPDDKRRLPRGFERFVKSDLCVEFVDSIYDYCAYLIKIEDKKAQLEEEARERRIPAPKMLQSETDRLALKAKRMADNYGRLIFMNRSIGQQCGLNEDPAAECQDKLQFMTKIYLNKENDNGFFSAVVKLFSKALKDPVKELEKKA